jgi:phage FluMu gp28-like protein
VWRGLRSWWSSWQQRRRLKRLDKTLKEAEEKARNLLRQKFEDLTDSPIKFAEKVLEIKPFPYQAKLLEDKSKRIVACMGRQTGKTTTIAMKAIHFADTNPKVLVLITSPSLRQSMIMFDRIASFVFSSPYLRNKVVRATRTLIQFENGSRIIALPCSENLLRGYTANMVICDEAAFMPEEVITQVIFPMLSTTDGYAIFLSTPWGKDHFFYRAFVNPAYSVHKVRANECPLITKEFLEEMRANMTREAFLMEYEAEFVEALNSYFPQDLIRKCVELAQKHELELQTNLEITFPKGEYYGGVDFGKLQDYSVLTVLKRDGDILKLIYMHQFPLETPYTQVIGHLVRAHQKFGFAKIFVDQTGVGEPVLEEIRNQGVRYVEGLKFTIQTKEELLTNLKMIMEQSRLAIPYHRRLCQQINEQQYEYSKIGHLRFSHPENSHDDMLWSLALAAYAARKPKKEPAFTFS